MVPTDPIDEAEAWFRAHWDLERTPGERWHLLAESGWGQPAWPVGRFGRGLARRQASEVVAVRRRVGALGGPTGIARCWRRPTLLAHGTPAQLDRYLPGTITGEHIWASCSRAERGSDLARCPATGTSTRGS